MSALYILEVKLLSKVSFANIFSHTVGSLFILLIFSLAMQKLFILIKSHLFILSFMSLALGDMSVRMLLCGMSEISLPIFPLVLLWCYDLYLSLLSTLNLFLCMVYVGDRVSFLLQVAVQLSQHHLMKKLFLLHFMLLPPLLNSN